MVAFISLLVKKSFAQSMGIAKEIPAVTLIELIPIASPSKFTRGPPEFPNWKTSFFQFVRNFCAVMLLLLRHQFGCNLCHCAESRVLLLAVERRSPLLRLSYSIGLRDCRSLPPIHPDVDHQIFQASLQASYSKTKKFSHCFLQKRVTSGLNFNTTQTYRINSNRSNIRLHINIL